MEEQKLEKMLNELANKKKETVSTELAENIKKQIPKDFDGHKRFDNVNILINLKINKVAAAIIIGTMILSVSLMTANTKEPAGFYHDGRLIIRYCLDGKRKDKNAQMAGMLKLYQHLVGKRKDVAYYPKSIDSKDRGMILMQWKVNHNKYKVILVNYGKLSIETVGPEKLIELQTRMLEKRLNERISRKF